jgi:S-adenosylmethionine uptake transporter
MTGRIGPAHSHAAALAFGFGGIALFSGMDAIIKHLASQEHALVVAVGRYLFALPFALAIWLRAGRPQVTRDMLKAHGLRAAIIAVAGALFMWALGVMPLADAIALSFVAPLILPFVAWAILKEKVRLTSVAASAVGFVGAAIAVSGGDDAAAAAGRDGAYYQLGVAAMLIFSLCYAVQISLLRARAEQDGSAIVGVLGTLLPALLLAGPAAAFGGIPQATSLPYFLAMGALGAVSLWMLTEAYARAEAQTIAPLEFTALPWAALFGYAFFAEVPRVELWIGAAIIIGACLWSGWKNAPPPQQPGPV